MPNYLITDHFYGSLATNSCNVYKIFTFLANYFHDFSISNGLLPYSNIPGTFIYKIIQTGFKACP